MGKRKHETKKPGDEKRRNKKSAQKHRIPSFRRYKTEKTLLWGIIISIAVILTDLFDGCSSLINKLGPTGFCSIALLCLCAALLCTKAWKWLRLPVATELDMAMLSGTVTGAALLAYTLALYITGDAQFHIYKPVLAAGTLLLLAAGLIYRRRRLACDEEEKNYNTYTLKELYQGEIAGTGGSLQPGIPQPDSNPSRIVYMEEEAVDYDLLNRGELIRTIRDIIRTCEPRGKYVIGLSGAWGQGKTTVINNVKKELEQEKDIVVIDSFDPWNYETKEALFSGMLDAIFRYAGIDYNVSRIRSWKKQLGELIFDINDYTKGLKMLLNREQETVWEIKALMNDFLGRCRRKIVFVLDNIERMDDPNILLLFKLVADVLDLDHVIYVLSYDAERIGKVLEEAGLKDSYLKKVIQMEFYVPPIDEGRKREIFFVCLKNLLELYQAEERQQEELLHLSSSFLSKMSDVRDIKRFFNSVISPCYGVPDRWIRKLSAKDYVVMELLKRENPLLYNEIAKNPYYFVSSDRQALFGHEIQTDWKKKLNEEAKSYFSNLFSRETNEKNAEWQDLLAEIFPYVENYAEGRDVVETSFYGVGSETYKSIIQNARIRSGKFFPQYFTLQSNDYMKIKLELDDVMQAAKEGEEAPCREKFTALLRRYPGSDQTEVVEMLQLFSEDLDQAGWDILFPTLYEMSEEIYDGMRFFGYSARKRTYYLLSVGLDKISDSLFERFLVGIQGQYDRLWALGDMLYHKQKNPDRAEAEPPRYEGRALPVYETLRQMAEKIEKEGINLYSDRYYRPHNIWGWYHIVKYMPDIDIKKTAAPMLGEQSVYRFLWDMTQKSVGSGYGYTLRENYFNTFTDRDRIASLLGKRTPCTDSEAFVRRLWDAYLEQADDDDRESHEDIVTTEYYVEPML